MGWIKNRLGLQAVFAAGMVCVFVSTGLSAAEQPAGADWPQWRGPNRDGIASSSPKLAEAWPKEGPKQLWKSTPMPSGQDGGLGSVVVAGGKVYVYVNWKSELPISSRTLSTNAVQGLGWVAEMPDDLAQKIEEARLSDKRAGLKGEDLNKYIKEFAAANLGTGAAPAPGQASLVQKFGNYVQARLSQPPDALNWEALSRLAGIRDMEFTDAAEFEKVLGELGISEAARKPILNVVPAKAAKFVDTIVCLDAATGQEVWKREFPGRGYDWGCSATPTVVGDKVYITASNARLYCLAAKDGALLWVTATKNGGRDSSSALVVGNSLFVLGGELMAFNAQNGRWLWSQPKVRATENSAVLWTNDGKSYLICNTPGKVFCVEPEKGELRWEAEGGGCSTAAVSGDTMVIYSERGLLAYTLTPQAAQPLWAKKEWKDRGASAIIYQDCVYVVGGRMACAELKTGTVKWEQRAGGEITSPILCDGKIISGVDNCDSTVIFKAAPDKFEQLGRAKLRQLTCSSPAIVAGKLYLRLVDGVGCYDLAAPAP